MKIFGYTFAEVKKFVVAGAGSAVLVANELLKMNDVLPASVATWATVVVSLGTALGVFGVPNLQPEPAEVTAPEPKVRKRLPIV